MQGEIVKQGQAVKVVDELGVLHDGLVTANWGNDNQPSGCINVVYVSKDEKKRDQYGQQKEHLSSCSHRDMTSAPGRYWFITGDRKP